MKYKTVIFLIGMIGILITSCDSKKSKPLDQSKFLIDSIFSENLLEYRKHNIYLPKGFSKEKKYPIIYATDGNCDITGKKDLLDSLIDNKIIKPIIFVASFSNNQVADSTSTTLSDGSKVHLTYRNFEYVDRKLTREQDSMLFDRFKNHMNYFSNELIIDIEKKFNQECGKENRFFYGVSNGAGFGMSLLNKKPELIGTYLCFSTFGGDIQTNDWDKKVQYPNLYLRYGSEEFFLQGDADFLKAKYAELNSFIEIKTYEGGHNNRFWTKEFTDIISKLF